MSIIVCPKCKKEYDVPLKVLGKKVNCKGCGASFEAQVLRQQVRKEEKKSPIFYLMWSLGIGLFIIVVLIIQSFMGDEEKPVNPEDEASTEIQEPEFTTDDKEEVEEPSFPKTERESFVLTFLDALRTEDIDGIQRMFNYSSYHSLRKAPGEPQWNDYSDLDQVMKKQEYTEKLTDDTPQGGGGVRKSSVISMNETEWDGERGKVDVGFENQHNGRLHERTYMIQRLGSQYVVIDFTVGPEHGGDLDLVKEEGIRTLDEKYKRRISPEGELKEVPFPPDTDESLQTELKELAEDLLSENRRLARESREKLINHGKPAIPAILNQIVSLDLTDAGDVGRANKCVSALRIITGQSFGFNPGMYHESILESQAADYRRSLRYWFGWWEKNKETWAGRDMGKEMEDW